VKRETQTRRQLVAALLVEHLGLDPETARAASLPIPGTIAETMIVEARCYEDRNPAPALPDPLVYRLLDALQLAADALQEEHALRRDVLYAASPDPHETAEPNDWCDACKALAVGQTALDDAAAVLAPPLGSLLPHNPFTVGALLDHQADERARNYARGR